MAEENVSLRELAIEYDKKTKERPFEEQYYIGKRDPSTSVLAILVLIFVFFALLFWAGLAVGRPSWCLGPSLNIDNGKTFGAALLIAFFILIIVVIIWCLAGGINSGNNSSGLAIALIIVILVLIIFSIIWSIIYYSK